MKMVDIAMKICHLNIVVTVISKHLVVVPFTLPEDLAKISIPYYTVQLPVEAREQFVSSCTLAIWQPPKIS
ncbi:MAG: hypothetical protein IPM77_07110 [Crocinitomicaceae bacterium]|nr:hypothetical protein [Crocinitomicaceae bacterium]